MEGKGGVLRIELNALDGPNRHICAFFNGMDEHYRVLRPFIKEGLDQGDRACHLIDPERREDHLRRLTDAGIDVDQAMSSGQLDVRSWEETYLREDRFDQAAVLALVEQLLATDRGTERRRVRMVGQMEWAMLDKPGVNDLIEYESRVNHLVPKYDGAVICAYDLSQFGADTVIYALRTHPVVIIGGLVQENPFYVDPDDLLVELREQRSSPSGARMAH